MALPDQPESKTTNKRHQKAVTELAARLSRGEALDDIRRTLLPADWTDVLKAAAVARFFDAKTYDTVLREFVGAQAPPLASLVSSRVVEEAAGRSLLQVSDAHRPSYLLSWLDDGDRDRLPDELLELERRLSEHWCERGKPAEQLRHLMLVDPDAATGLFDSLFDTSDADRDFTRCEDLTRVLADRDRAAVVKRSLLKQAEDRAGYLRARTYWAPDYARSAQFLEPDGLWQRARSLLDGRGARVWQMHGIAGSGKTMQLRWLVARKAVTAEEDVNCARIDFDVVDPLNAARWPWLLLLEIADQLEQRLPTRVFTGLDEYAAYRSLLRRPTSRAAAEAARGIRTQDEHRIEREVVQAFTSRFAETFGKDRPVLIVVDTLEEVVLRSASRTDSLLRLLGETVRSCQAIRLILSGRLDLGRRHRQALDTMGDWENVHLPLFTPEQADRYLHGTRGIQSRELRELVIRRSEGLPFHLALFADDIDQNPEVTADEVSRLSDPAVRRHYLVSKVVGRIDDPVVRWLVYYGVIPRRLGRSHVLDIVQPRLARKMKAGGVSDPSTQQLFAPIPPPSRKQLDEAWRRLIEYAGTYSWISGVPGDEEALVFHSALLGPMRDLLSETADFALLHGDFARHFETLAENDPANWSRHLREAHYHRFLMKDPKATEVWRATLERAWTAGETDRLRDLAEDVLGDEYREASLGTAHGSVVPLALMAEAHLYIAYAQFREAMTDDMPSDLHDHMWSEVELHLVHADELYEQAGMGPDRDHSVREDVVRATVLGLRGNADDAVALIERRVLSSEGLPALERLWALNIRAASLRLLRSPDTAAACHEAWVFASRIGRPDIAANAASLEAAQRRLMGEVGEAIDLYARAVRLHTKAKQPAFGAAAQQAGLLLRCRRPRQALDVLGRAGVTTAAEQADKARLEAKANLLLGREIPALAAIQRADEAAGALQGTDRYRHWAQNAQLHGVALGELQAISDADNRFTSATGLWKELGYLAGEPECHYLYARFLLRDSLDFQSAHRLLEPKEAPGQEPEFALRLLLLASEWAHRSQGVTAVAGLPLPYDELPALVRPLHALCRLAGLPEDQPPDGILRQLTEALAEVRPAQARLATLRDLVDNPALENRVPWPLLAPYFELDGPADDPDRALADLLIAQVRGQEEAARLERMARTLIDSGAGSRLIVWRCARIAARLGHRELAVRLLDEVPWEEPPDVSTCGGLKVPHVRLALATLVLQAGIAPTRAAAWRALSRAMALAEERNVIRPSLPGMLADVARRLQVDGVHQQVRDLLESRQRPAVLDTDLPGDLRLFKDWPRERGLGLRSRPDIDPVNEEALPQPRKLLAWHQDQWPLRVALSNSVLRQVDYVRLESDAPLAHALPWEQTLQSSLDTVAEQPVMYRTLPTAGRRLDVRWMQLCLNRRLDLALDVDGIVGPETRAALEQLQPGGLTTDWPLLAPETRRELQRGIPRHSGPHRVLVLSGKQDERSVSLSYWLRGPRPLPAHLPVSVTVVEPDTDVVRHLPAPAGGVDILHVAAPLRQRDGMPYLELSPAGHARRLASKARGSDLFPLQMSRWLAGFEPGRIPLVVLDPPCPGSEVDIGVQLTLRNLFAAQLFCHGYCPAIVCTGLFPEGGLDHVIGLYQELSEGRPLAYAVRDLRAAPAKPSSHGTTFETDDDARRAIALFASGSTLPPLSLEGTPNTAAGSP